MHRGRVADALLPQIVLEQAASIVVISEQYSRKTEGGEWFDDRTGTAAIWVPNNSPVRPLNNGRGNGFVWIKLEDFFLVSCYLTPSDNMEEFQCKLDAIEDELRRIEGNFVVAGDFNSRAVEWGSQSTNARGRRVLEMAARTGLSIANIGNIPTFKRPGCEGTIPDITLVTETIAGRIKKWKVLDIYTGSDHQYISYSFQANGTGSRQIRNSTRRWNKNKLEKNFLITEIDRHELSSRENAVSSTVKRTMEAITKACDKAMPKVSRIRRRQSVYWWNENIAELRRKCLSLRRSYTRARRRGSAESEREAYKESQKILRYAIKKSKKDKWEELRADINRDPWGLGYKIVLKKLGSKNPVEIMDAGTMDVIVKTLFPTHNLRPADPVYSRVSPLPPFSEEELKGAAARLRLNKAPGPDGIPVEVLRVIVEKRPKILLDMYNCCLLEGVFPDMWKEQRLVLIRKGKGDPSSPSSYRPLCLLNTAGKLLERMLKPRLQEAIRVKGGLSERQHGFRTGKSVLGALKDVVDVVLKARERNHHSRPIVLLATLDVKNAFNSLKWSDVLQALEENFNVPCYLMRIIRSYLKDRILLYETTQGTKRMHITAGAAQGSILGPDLWNASYDGILRMSMPEGVFLVGYADDIAAVIQARTMEDAQRKLNQVMIRSGSWLKSHGLELALHKTELLLLTGRRIPTEVDMKLGNMVMTTKKFVNYLGVRLDTKLTFSHQIEYSTKKASNITARLSKIMANVGGPIAKRRKLLMEASNSILLYGCEIWGMALRTQNRVKKLISVQRTAALRVASAYRTVSAPAVQIIAGMIPIDLQVKERRNIFVNKQANTAYYRRMREDTLRMWQARWDNERRGRWTARLIPEVGTWMRRTHGEVNYYLTQLLSGHGYFRKYLYRNNKCSSPYCIYEDKEHIDDAEHTFFHCSKWRSNRQNLELLVGTIAPENIIEKMLAAEENWIEVAKYCETVLRRKKVDLDRM